jgi:hypothetical protein
MCDTAHAWPRSWKSFSVKSSSVHEAAPRFGLEKAIVSGPPLSAIWLALIGSKMYRTSPAWKLMSLWMSGQ